MHSPHPVAASPRRVALRGLTRRRCAELEKLDERELAARARDFLNRHFELNHNEAGELERVKELDLYGDAGE